MSMIIDLGDALTEGYALLRLPRMTDDEFWEFCQRNPTLQVERNADGDVILMSPSDTWTEIRGGDLFGDLLIWNRAQAEPGLTAGSSAGFKLPNGAERSPDAAWVSKARWDALPPEKRRRFAQISPDFVAEVMSPSDRLKDAKAKMEEYIANGVRLGWLIDRKKRTVIVYRPGQAEQEIYDPATLAGDPELPGFVADMARVFQTDTGE